MCPFTTISKKTCTKARYNKVQCILLLPHTSALFTVLYWSGLQHQYRPVQICILGGADSLPIHNNEKAPSAIQMASRPSHLIHPMGEKSIQILKLAGGRYPFWSASVCLFAKEQSRIKKRRERETVVCCVIPRGIIIIGPQGIGEGCCVYANTDGIVTKLQFRLILDTDRKNTLHHREPQFTQQTVNVTSQWMKDWSSYGFSCNLETDLLTGDDG